MHERQIELIGLAKAEGARFGYYDEEIGRVNGERIRLLRIKAELEMAEQPQASLERRIEEVNAALLQESGMIEGYDDIRTRQLVSNIKVLDKKRLLIRFKDGTEVLGSLKD